MSQTTVSTVAGHPGVPLWMPDGDQHRRMIAAAVQRHNSGKFNAFLDVTLNASTGATLIQDNRIGYYTAVIPAMALTLNGSAALAAGIWFDTPSAAAQSTAASIVAHHRNNAATDQKIRFVLLG